ncbi:hydroxymethylbilane synthase [Puteibacter caeruleilacunae]|nr:hydroxymethylbilane synthase [Puteibacter caeruleilacunae]
MQDNTIIIGTRGSQLAMYQANIVRETLLNTFPSIKTEIKIIKTKGDKILDVALSKIGDKGLFTKELEVAMLNNEIDLAVHSLKDLPTQLPEGFSVSAILKRGNFRDALVSRDGLKLCELTSQHKIATSSLRRIANLRNYNPEFQIIDIRGNVNTRLKKMEDGYCDAMVMAAAGLERLGLDHYITEILDPVEFIPAVAQGAIAVETLTNNSKLNELLSNISDSLTESQVTAERAFMKKLEGGCQVPVGAYTSVNGKELILTGFVSSTDASEFLKDSIVGSTEEAQALGERLAIKLINQGANDILNAIRAGE